MPIGFFRTTIDLVCVFLSKWYNVKVLRRNLVKRPLRGQKTLYEEMDGFPMAKIQTVYTHFMTPAQTPLCGSKVATKKLSTDKEKVDCLKCIEQYPFFTDKALEGTPESPEEQDEILAVQKVSNPLDPTQIVSSDMSGNAAKVQVKKSGKEPIANLIQLDPMKIQIRADLVSGRWNPRSDFSSVPELAKDIMDNGLLHPLTVYLEDGYYWLEDGERRLRAIRMLREQDANTFPFVDCIVNGKPLTISTRLLAALTHNQGEALNALDEARAIQRLLNLNVKPQTIAARMHRSTNFITERTKLLQADEQIQALYDDKLVSTSEILKIIKMAQSQKLTQEEAFKRIIVREDLRTKAAQEAKAAAEEAERQKQEAIAQEKLEELGKETLEQQRKNLEEKNQLEKERQELEAAKAAMALELQKLHTDAQTTITETLPTPTGKPSTPTPVLPPLPASTGETTTKPRRRPLDVYAGALAAGLDPTDYTKPYNALNAIMDDVITDERFDLDMITYWLIRVCGAEAVSESCNKSWAAIKEQDRQAAQAKGKTTPTPGPGMSGSGKPLSPLQNVPSIIVPAPETTPTPDAIPPIPAPKSGKSRK